MLKFLSMRAVSLSATMVLGVSGMALAASHVAEEVPVDPVPVIEQTTVAAVEESAATPEAEVAKEEVVAEKQRPCLDCSESAPVDLIELAAAEVDCQDGNHGKTVSLAARTGGDVKAAAHSDCGKKHQEDEPSTIGDTAAIVDEAEATGAAVEVADPIGPVGEVEAEDEVGPEGQVESDAAAAEIEVDEGDGSGRDKAKSNASSNGQGHGKDKKNK